MINFGSNTVDNIKFRGNEVNLVKYNGSYVWAKPLGSLNIPSKCVRRESSYEPTAETGQLKGSSEPLIYYNDVCLIVGGVTDYINGVGIKPEINSRTFTSMVDDYVFGTYNMGISATAEIYREGTGYFADRLEVTIIKGAGTVPLVVSVSLRDEGGNILRADSTPINLNNEGSQSKTSIVEFDRDIINNTSSFKYPFIDYSIEPLINNKYDGVG